MKLKTNSRTFLTVEVALWVVSRLVNQSQWFMFEPLPDDLYEITVKEEIGYMLWELPSEEELKK